MSVFTDSGNDGLSPVRCNINTWTNAGLLSIGPLGTNFSGIRSRIILVSSHKIHWKMPSPTMVTMLSRGGDELITHSLNMNIGNLNLTEKLFYDYMQSLYVDEMIYPCLYLHACLVNRIAERINSYRMPVNTNCKMNEAIIHCHILLSTELKCTHM